MFRGGISVTVPDFQSPPLTAPNSAISGSLITGSSNPRPSVVPWLKICTQKNLIRPERFLSKTRGEFAAVFQKEPSGDSGCGRESENVGGSYSQL